MNLTELTQSMIDDLKQQEIEIYDSYRNLPNGKTREQLHLKEQKLMQKRHSLIAKIN